MASDGEYEATQTQSQSNDASSWLVAENNPELWGKLVSQNKALADCDLVNSTFIAGRMNTSDCRFTQALSQRMLVQLSKIHFKLVKNLSDVTNPVYIEDHSRNGTYVNGDKLGKGHRRILAHNDTISVAHPLFKAFIYKNSYRCRDVSEEIVGKYHIGQKLGSGACGIVYTVYDYKTLQPFAVKQIKKHQMNGYEKGKAMNEGEIMKTIKHPCVVKMFDVVDSGDSVYIILELMQGGDLLSRITKSTFLSENVSKLFFYQMCHTIKYLHDRNITHRDLKPDNILLASSDAETLIKISDFGLSKLVENNSVLRTMCGTPHYVAPEVLLTQGRGQYTEKVDIWSLGVVLFTCLSGTLPFSNDYGSPAMEQIKNADFKFRSKNWTHVSLTAKKLIRDLLTVDVDKRPSIDKLLKHEWFDDFEMKSKAHQIMNISPPCKWQAVLPANDENAQPMKRRRVC